MKIYNIEIEETNIFKKEVLKDKKEKYKNIQKEKTKKEKEFEALLIEVGKWVY